MGKYKTITKWLRRYYKDILEILTLLSGLVGTILITLASQISRVKHGLPSGGMAYSVVLVHPNSIRWGIGLIILAFGLGITKFIVTKIGEEK